MSPRTDGAPRNSDGQAEPLLNQLTEHYDNHVAPRLATLTDEEYLWEPCRGCWSIRPRAQARSAMAAGGGEWVIDFDYPEPDPPPFTTIAWRLAHLSVGILGMRNAAHFGAPAVDYQSAHYSTTATGALADLDHHYRRWVVGVSTLDDQALGQVVGPADPGLQVFRPQATMTELILHIHREAIHHLAEVLAIRDLYRSRTH